MAQLNTTPSSVGRKVLSKLEQHLSVNVKQSVKQVVGGYKGTLVETGGSAWESNPPKTLLTPPNGVEVREAHRDSSAPANADKYILAYQAEYWQEELTIMTPLLTRLTPAASF
jgi:hypothetical protein